MEGQVELDKLQKKTVCLFLGIISSAIGICRSTTLLLGNSYSFCMGGSGSSGKARLAKTELFFE